MTAEFTLIVVATEDGFIARRSGHAPHDWASPEEQALFFAEVDAADWGIMGRGTHAAAPRPDRRRVVFSTSAPMPEWRAPTQVWVDPATLTADDLPGLVSPVRPLRRGVILGGTGVHDWFLAQGRIDRILLTVEPLRFGDGLPVFSAHPEPPEAAIRAAGFAVTEDRRLNAGGTRLLTCLPV